METLRGIVLYSVKNYEHVSFDTFRESGIIFLDHIYICTLTTVQSALLNVPSKDATTIYYALGAEKVHDLEYQESHQALLKNEVERLKSVLFNKVDK